MSPSLLGAGALLVLAGSGTMILLAWAFCVRPAPRELRILRECFLFALALRVMTVDFTGAELTVYRDPSWIGLGLAGLVLAGWNLRRVSRRGGDRCPTSAAATLSGTASIGATRTATEDPR